MSSKQTSTKSLGTSVKGQNATFESSALIK